MFPWSHFILKGLEDVRAAPNGCDVAVIGPALLVLACKIQARV